MSATTTMPTAGSALSLSRAQLTERLSILLEVNRREVVDFVVLQEGIYLHPRFEPEQPAIPT
ncbi:MAG TPA: hypothetical protein VEU96_04325 [Bryobacteraceae bacterium]|nr:hypothetical protein [Bryobacteraceae bacterium]